MSFIRKFGFMHLSAGIALLGFVGFGGVLTGCGFEPLYGKSAKGDARLLKLVQIERIEDRTGQKMRTMLRQKFGQRAAPAKPRWSLSVSLSESLRGLAVQRDATTTRRELAVTTRFSLTELGVKNPRIFRGNAISINSFNELLSEYATLSAENDARDRALRILSEEIRVRVMSAIRNPASFNKRPGK